VLPPLRHAVSASCTSVCAFDRPARTFDFGGCSRLAAEEDRESWNKSYRQTFLSEGYKAYLQAAAQELRAVRNGPGGVQLFNLSPAWCAAAAAHRRGGAAGESIGHERGAAVVEGCLLPTQHPPHLPLYEEPSSWPSVCLGTLAPAALPRRRNVEAYQLFDNSVFELPMEIWEKPSGLALCPLHIL
jgi:hypothetical protein